MKVALKGTGPCLGLTIEPYNDTPFHYRMKTPVNPGNIIRCHVCGASWKTLYKCKEGRICEDCRRNAPPRL